MLKQNDKVTVKRQIVRREGAYAQAGEQGVVTEFFRSKTEGGPGLGRLNAKVLMDSGEIKTFRLTSLEKQ